MYMIILLDTARGVGVTVGGRQEDFVVLISTAGAQNVTSGRTPLRDRAKKSIEYP
jgi:hypothetical protein